MIYPKIQTLWKRDMSNHGVIVEGDYSLENFKNIEIWDMSEKIDGMNIRIEFNTDSLFYGPEILFKGRREKSQIPKQLLEYLEARFTNEFFDMFFGGAHTVTIFGEGYGSGIQKGGGLYRETPGFVGFDILIDGWWLEQHAVFYILSSADISVVPCLGRATIPQIVAFIKRHPQSVISKYPKEMEGVVCRSYPLMLFRNKTPVMFKLKCTDYPELEVRNK